jgi:hypothetical protein
LTHPEIDVNIQNSETEVPSSKAVENGDVEIVKLLLAHPEIDVNIQNSETEVPLSKAVENGDV